MANEEKAEKKLIIDEDWKHQAQKEKASAKKEAFSPTPYSATDQIYSISTPSGQLAFMFGVQSEENLPPVIEAQDSYTARVGSAFAKKIQIESDDDYTLTDDTALFDIQHDGTIEFTPHIPGTYDVLITIEDQRKQIAKKVITFEIN